MVGSDNKHNQAFFEDLDADVLAAFLQQAGEPPYRVTQITKAMIGGVPQPEDMHVLPKTLIDRIRNTFRFKSLRVIETKGPSVDGTVKFLFELFDGHGIEGVLMKYKFGTTACISTQVGCKMACTFCASGRLGFSRNLSAYEMLRQVYLMQAHAKERISHVVLMGVGEPFDNYEQTMKFLRLLHDERGFGIGYRKMTVSTGGLVPKMLRFAKEGIPVNLSVSLHAPDDDVRKKVMPIAKKYSIDDILRAQAIYAKETGRRITFEYALIRGLNDDVKHASRLAKRLHGRLCHVNLIMINETEDGFEKRPSAQTLQRFYTVLKKAGIAVSVRRELGTQLDAACGQLRKKRSGPSS